MIINQRKSGGSNNFFGKTSMLLGKKSIKVVSSRFKKRRRLLYKIMEFVVFFLIRHANIFHLGAVHKLCRLGRGGGVPGEGVSP